LIYEFDNPSKTTNWKFIKVIQVFIEQIDQKEEHDIYSGNSLPKSKKIKFNELNLYKLAPLLRIKDEDSGVEVHLILDLDLKFYDGKLKNLECRQLTTDEAIVSLASAMEISIPAVMRRGDSDHIAWGKSIHELIGSLRLERYTYRLAQLKKKDHEEYIYTVDRVNRTLDFLPKDSEELHKVSNAIKICHGVTSGT